MAQAEGRYFASTASFETESERLQLVEAYGDPVTARQLEAVGCGWGGGVLRLDRAGAR
jgi:hypothetical protein